MENKIGNQDKKIAKVFDYLKQFFHENDKDRKRIGYR